MRVVTHIDPEITEADPEVARLVAQEIGRQSSTICLIPSENYVSPAVLEAMGSVFTNKYSEGYACSRTRARRRTWPCTSPAVNLGIP